MTQQNEKLRTTVVEWIHIRSMIIIRHKVKIEHSPPSPFRNVYPAQVSTEQVDTTHFMSDELIQQDVASLTTALYRDSACLLASSFFFRFINPK